MIFRIYKKISNFGRVHILVIPKFGENVFNKKLQHGVVNLDIEEYDF